MADRLEAYEIIAFTVIYEKHANKTLAEAVNLHEIT